MITTHRGRPAAAGGGHGARRRSGPRHVHVHSARRTAPPRIPCRAPGLAG